MVFSTGPKLRSAAIIFVAWTAIGLFFFSQGLGQKYAAHDPTPWWHYLVIWLIGVWLCALFTPIIFWLGRRFPIERRNWFRRCALHLLNSVVFSLVELVLHSLILTAIGLCLSATKTFTGTLALLMITSFHQNITTYWELLGIQYALGYYRRYREREEQALRLELQASELRSQLTTAQLSALKMQLQPHFLFNTMNAIMVLVRQQRGPQAEEMLGRLSDLLRRVLEDVEAQEVPVYRELEYLELYLAIEQVRFADRLRVDISAEPAALQAAVPHLGVQPIVENAIRHGIGRSSSAGNIKIVVRRAGTMLEVVVADDGPGFSPFPESSDGHGIGLANTRARLHQLYGDAASLRLENAPQHGAIVTLAIPYRSLAIDPTTDVMELHAVQDFAS